MLEIRIVIQENGICPRFAFFKDGTETQWELLSERDRIRALYAMSSSDKFLKTK